MTAPLRLFRFSIPEGVWRRLPEPNPTNIEVSDADAIVLAADMPAALNLAAERIGDWVRVAKRHTYALDRAFSALPPLPRELYERAGVGTRPTLLRVYKFIEPGVAVAAAVASSPDEARACIDYAAEVDGSDVEWIMHVEPVEFPIDTPAFITGHIG